MSEFGEPLSERELEVLHCVINGASNKEVALDLAISENTVKVHLRHIYSKLGVSSRTEATTAAIQRGLVTTLGGESIHLTPPTTNAPSSPEPPPSVLSPQSSVLSPQPSPRLTRPTIGLALLLLLIVVTLVGLLSWQAFTVNPEPTPEPFVEAPIGDTRWSVSRPMPIARANMAVAAVGLDIYQIGGETTTGVVNNTTIYHTTDHLWREAAARPTAVADTSAAVLFGEIYVPGGRLADGQPTNIVEVYSPANNAWRRVAALPQPIAGGLALVEGGFLYLFGGWNGEQYLDSGYVYDPGADTWRPLPSMSQARAFTAGGAVTGRLYVVGGFDGQSELSLCQFFDPTATAWFDCPAMLLPRAGAGSAVLVNKLYVIGGGLNGDSRVTFSEVYDPNTETWQVVNTPMLDDTSAWANLGVASVETRIYVLGGRRAGQLNADNFVYAPFVYQTYIPAASSGGDN